VFEIFQTGFDEQGRPIRLTVSVYPTDRNQFAVDIGRVPDLVVVPAFGR
jgi:GntR family transcriptional regulator